MRSFFLSLKQKMTKSFTKTHFHRYMHANKRVFFHIYDINLYIVYTKYTVNL